VKILAGTHDTIVSPTIHSRTLSQQIPNAHFEFVSGTGHTLQHSATEEIDAMLAELDADLTAIAAAKIEAELAEEAIEEPKEELTEEPAEKPVEELPQASE